MHSHAGAWERSKIINQYRIKEMHQQIAVFLRAKQCLEYTIYLGVYAVFHGGFSSPDGTKWNPGFRVIVSRIPLCFIQATLA